MDDKTLTIRDYEDALAQNACNLSGLVKSLARVTDKIWEEARSKNKGTDYVNHHPIVRLYLEQLNFLNENNDQDDSWSTSMSYCEDKIKELRKAEEQTKAVAS